MVGVSVVSVFFDFDGVLHPTTHGSVLFSNANLLEYIFLNHQCNIVISSSWRFHVDLDDFKLRLADVIHPHMIDANTLRNEKLLMIHR